MSWHEKQARLLRFVPLLLAGSLLGGCFQPMYGDRTLVGGASVAGTRTMEALKAVDVKQIVAPNGTPLARLAVEVRNDLLFNLTGGSVAAAPTHELDIKLSSSTLSVIVDINSARPDIQNYGIDAVYALKELGTGKIVARGTTFARVAFDTPGQQQRFVGARALRDAEDRAAKVIADQIHSRLASFFVAGA
jgi:LPS-assembly lipoprotein